MNSKEKVKTLPISIVLVLILFLLLILWWYQGRFSKSEFEKFLAGLAGNLAATFLGVFTSLRIYREGRKRTNKK
ncbi:MAG: hypothetical protein JW991_00215 [Candidatus Pacebacteria bacterium]|nr:hypothetical protein [Candidatus Paceibacterota bacterium]